jgi:hypothetical protein
MHLLVPLHSLRPAQRPVFEACPGVLLPLLVLLTAPTLALPGAPGWGAADPLTYMVLRGAGLPARTRMRHSEFSLYTC